MIKQDVVVKVGCMVAEFSKGDIAVGVMKTDKNNVAVTLSNLPEKHNVGDDVSNEKDVCTPMVMIFENLDSLNVVRKIFDKAAKMLKEKENETKTFVVPIENIFVTSAFKTSNPKAEKILECSKYFDATGELDRDIVVKNSLTLEDGYVAYLVALYNGVKVVKVVAPNGVRVKVGNEAIVFVNDMIAVDCVAKEEAFEMILENGGETYHIPVESIEAAAELVAKLNKTFIVKCSVASLTEKSELNMTFVEELRKRGINSAIK